MCSQEKFGGLLGGVGGGTLGCQAAWTTKHISTDILKRGAKTLFFSHKLHFSSWVAVVLSTTIIIILIINMHLFIHKYHPHLIIHSRYHLFLSRVIHSLLIFSLPVTVHLVRRTTHSNTSSSTIATKTTYSHFHLLSTATTRANVNSRTTCTTPNLHKVWILCSIAQWRL